MAQTDGLQGETGKEIFKYLKNECENPEHIKHTQNPKRSRNGNSQLTYERMKGGSAEHQNSALDPLDFYFLFFYFSVFIQMLNKQRFFIRFHFLTSCTHLMILQTIFTSLGV